MLNFKRKMVEEEVDMEDQTKEVLDRIVRTQKRCEELSQETGRLGALLDQSEREVEFLRGKLVSMERRSDMYQRHAVALYTRMVDLLPTIRGFADTIERGLQDAKVEATQVAPKVTAQDLDEDITSAVRQSIEERKED